MTQSLVRTICPKCSAVGFDAEKCDKCGIHFEAFRRHQEKLKTEGMTPWRNAEDAFDPALRADRAFYDWKFMVYPLPIAILATLFLKLLGPLDLIPTYLITIPTHELGHTLMAWLNGYFAVPLGAIIPMAAVTQVAHTRSAAVTLLATTGLALILYLSLRARRLYPALVSAILIAASLFLTVKLPERDSMLLIIWAGYGGEIILGAILILSYFHRAPVSWRWDFFRFPMLGYGTYAFVSAMIQWRGISKGTRPLPIGSFLDIGNSGGDMGTLLNTYRWSQARIIQTYLGVGKVCMVLILLHYGYFAGQALIRALARSDRSFTS